MFLFSWSKDFLAPGVNVAAAAGCSCLYVVFLVASLYSSDCMNKHVAACCSKGLYAVKILELELTPDQL